MSTKTIKPKIRSLNPIRKKAYFLLESFLPIFPQVKTLKFLLLKPIHIKYIQLSLTYDCQCSCTHCGMSKYENLGEKLTTEEILNIIDNLVESGFGQIDFFGGEPLLDDHIYSYIKYAAKKGIFTHVNTNGLLLSHDNVAKLRKNGLHAISISFDSPNPQEHNNNRGIEHTFEQALAGAKDCIENKIKTIMSIYATSEEIISGNTARLINLAKENNFSAVRLLAPFQVGQLAENNHTYTPEASIQLKIILSKYPHFIKTHGIWNCFVPHKTNVYISPFGDVQPCSMIPFAFGNIHREDLYAILKRMRNHALCNIEEPGCVMNSLYMKELMHKESAVTTQSLPIHIR